MASLNVAVDRKQQFKAHWPTIRSRFPGSDVELASRTGVDRNTFRRWEEEGVSRDKENALSRVLLYLGVDPDSVWEPELRFLETPVIPVVSKPGTSNNRTAFSQFHDDLDWLLLNDPYNASMITNLIRALKQLNERQQDN